MEIMGAVIIMSRGVTTLRQGAKDLLGCPARSSQHGSGSGWTTLLLAPLQFRSFTRGSFSIQAVGRMPSCALQPEHRSPDFSELDLGWSCYYKARMVLSPRTVSGRTRFFLPHPVGIRICSLSPGKGPHLSPRAFVSSHGDYPDLASFQDQDPVDSDQ